MVHTTLARIIEICKFKDGGYGEYTSYDEDFRFLGSISFRRSRGKGSEDSFQYISLNFEDVSNIIASMKFIDVMSELYRICRLLSRSEHDTAIETYKRRLQELFTNTLLRFDTPESYSFSRRYTRVLFSSRKRDIIFASSIEVVPRPPEAPIASVVVRATATLRTGPFLHNH